MPNPAQVMPETVQSLYIEPTRQAERVSRGTGFLVRHEGTVYLVTNRHMLAGTWRFGNELIGLDDVPPDAVTIHHVAATEDGADIGWILRDEPLFADGHPTWLEHPSLGSRMDVVALPLTNLDGVQTDCYEIWEPQPGLYIGPAARVMVIGFPFGNSASGLPDEFPAIWTTGYMATDPMIDCDGLPYSWVDARTRTGQSGSPVVAVRISDLTITNLDGSITFLGALPEVRLVGVYSGRMNAESDLGRVWKLAALKELLTDGTSATVDFTPPQ